MRCALARHRGRPVTPSAAVVAPSRLARVGGHRRATPAPPAFGLARVRRRRDGGTNGTGQRAPACAGQVPPLCVPPLPGRPDVVLTSMFVRSRARRGGGVPVPEAGPQGPTRLVEAGFDAQFRDLAVRGIGVAFLSGVEDELVVRCPACGRRFALGHGHRRDAVYRGHACRQTAYRARRRAERVREAVTGDRFLYPLRGSDQCERRGGDGGGREGGQAAGGSGSGPGGAES